MRPSVIMMAPAMRSCGTSASAEVSAVNSRVPSVSPSDCPASTKRTSRLGMRPSRSATWARAASVWAVRSPKSWLALLSITTTATEVSGSRSSRVIDGLASASTNSASATVRISAPRLRENTSSSEIKNATAAATQSTASGTSGANEIPKFIPTPRVPDAVQHAARQREMVRR